MIKRFIKGIFSIIPFKKQLYGAIRTIWTPPHSVYKHLYFKGKLIVPVQGYGSFNLMHYGFEIENEIFWRGLDNGWEKISIGLWKRLCEESKVIFDIGANTGVYALVAKTINPDSNVFAFEPVERVFLKLVKNCELNKYNINCFQQAISNYTGKAVIYDTGGDHILSVTVNKNLQSSSMPVNECEIETITLKKVIEDHRLDRIDLMKIDVETHEAEVLEGFSSYLKIFRPTLLIEVLNNEIGTKIQELTKDIGYLYYNIDENHGVKRARVIGKSDYYNYLLCSVETANKLNLDTQ